MAALSDSVFRRLIKRQGGCGFLVTEMVPAGALVRGDPRSRELLRYHDEERPIGGQIMGGNPSVMAAAARLVEALGFDFVDVNMGCPSRKVVSGGGGSALMRSPATAHRIVAAIRAAVSIPVTIKLRAGWNDDCLNAPEVARAGEEAGAALVTVHARTRADQYRPGIRTELLARTRDAISVPLIANGDIRDPAGAAAVLRAAGCDGVMIGRGAVGNPWLLRAIAVGHDAAPTAESSRRWILDHFDVLRSELEPRRLLGKLRTFSGWYTRGLMFGAHLRERIASLHSPDEFVEAVEEFFDSHSDVCGPLQPGHQECRP